MGVGNFLSGAWAQEQGNKIELSFLESSSIPNRHNRPPGDSSFDIIIEDIG